MDKAKVLVGNDTEAGRPHAAGQGRRSLLGWVRKKLRRIMNRKKRDKDLEIYPLF
jgi:hypothetical protein